MTDQEKPADARPEEKEWTPEQEHVREALRVVIDPEIGIDVVTLGLIRDILFHQDDTEVQMIMTTPFCPYAGTLIRQVQDVTAHAANGEARVTLLDEPMWDPSMMEGGDIMGDWGLI
jgi:metal-sulfur cluster biosynthetic enzyme